MKVAPVLACLACLSAGCGDVSEPAPSGLGEPLRVTYKLPKQDNSLLGQFFPGELVSGTDGPTTPLRGIGQPVVFPGASGLKLTGNAQPTATAVGIRLDDLGTGYWVVPTTILDVENPGTIKFDASLDFGRDVPAGVHNLRIVAIDREGRRGPPAELLKLSFQPQIPMAPAVAVLNWDNNADVDLQIVLPDTTQLDRKHPRTTIVHEDGDAAVVTSLERDSNASCIPDGRRQEMFVWRELPALKEPYLAKADLFSACGEPGANFVFNFYLGGELKVSQAGRFLAQDADNGSPGLAVANFNFGN